MPRPINSRRRSRRVSGPRHPTIWLQTAFNGNVAIGGEATGNFLDFLDTVQKTRAKILAIHGNLTIRPTSAELNVFFGFGTVVLNNDAIAAGIVPDPLNDTNQGWHIWVASKTRRDADAGAPFERFPFQSTLSRWVRGDNDYSWVLESDSISATALDFSIDARLLVQI